MNTTESALLVEIAALSREFGTPDFVRGGGGNASCKSADTLWVKPSGRTLAGLTPASFVALDRARLGALYELPVPAAPRAREALVKAALAAAARPGPTARPSVEAPLHDLLAGRFVVHVHPALVNGMTCAQHGAEVCARLFPEALWVPYIDPGYTLCMGVRDQLHDYTRRHGRPPALIVLESHGVFATGDTAEGLRAVFHGMMRAMQAEYVKAGVSLRLPVGKPPSAQAAESVRQALQALLGAEAACVAGSGPFRVAPGPISPDHVVYAKAYPYEGPLTGEGLEAFRARHGYAPLVYMTAAGVFTIGASRKKADYALDLALDGALVLQLAEAFGGIQYMTERARLFIEQWEVESYRQKQVG
ncbi:MAG: class II aldolase/adducin family protein [Kiritimatiellaeota bacterium]|nr:class II aldolase/adducin family protein [Kiritimatiellota bacterium]